MSDKIYPIKVERDWDHKYKLVEWKLGNTCNYDCSFCGTEIKDGSERWLDINLYKKICYQLIQQAKLENKKVIFQFTGGEPTLFPDLIELLRFVKINGGYSNLISNGSRTLRWWREFADENLLTTLFITAHSEQNCDINHIVSITELFVDKPTFVLVQCTALPEFFYKALHFYDTIMNNACCKVSMKLINSTHDLQYTDEQRNKIADSIVVPTKNYNSKKLPDIQYAGKMKVTMNDGTVLNEFSHTLIARGLNKFFGYKCAIGVDYLNIIYDKIYRGICREGGVVGTIYDDVKWQEDWITCFKSTCSCGTDYHEPKYRIVKN